MVSVTGTDIITYIGVPLAVLGVLPIIYNTIATLVTLANVRRMLRHGRLAGITRGDVINHVIEVELPRYTIAPLNREEQIKEYWGLCDYPSQIPGGSWTIFNWKTHTIGLKTQRIDYSDQLRQPQAEIGFEELISFLLDLGAVPDPTGFRMLRGSGLWVPIGTPLLLSPDRRESVLRIAPLDDSDGNLSLAVRWSSNWGVRDHTSLPPYWVLIKGRLPSRPTSNSTLDKQPLGDRISESYVTETDPDKTIPTDEIIKPTDKKSQKPSISKYVPMPEESPPAIRCQVGTNGLIAAIPDDFDAQMFESLEISHLKVDEANNQTTGAWFASGITALGTSSQTILWNYKIPSEILSFAKKHTIPCGILVLLDIIEDSSTPEWATVYNDEEEAREAQIRKIQQQSRAMLRETQLPPDQKAQAFRDRTMNAHDDWMEELKVSRRRDAQRKEQRVLEAMQSPKWGNKLVAEHFLAWLKKEGHVEAEHGLKRTAEILLWRMVNKSDFAGDLAGLLDEWRAFADNGGMRKAEYLMLKERKVLFAWASLLLAVVEDSVTATHVSLAMDLSECIRVWKKVRLG